MLTLITALALALQATSTLVPHCAAAADSDLGAVHDYHSPNHQPSLDLRDLAARDYSSLSTNLRTINSDCESLRRAAVAYNQGTGGSPGNQLSQLDRDIKQATQSCGATSGTFTSAQATALIDYIKNTLAPSLQAAVDAVIAAKAKIVQSGLKTTFKNLFQRLYDDTNSFCSCLKSKCPAAQQSAAQTACNKLLAEIQNGINAFS